MTLGNVWENHTRWRKDDAQTCATPKAYADAVEGWKTRKRGAGKDERYIEESGGLLTRFGEGRERQNLHEITYAPACLSEIGKPTDVMFGWYSRIAQFLWAHALFWRLTSKILGKVVCQLTLGA